jgi:gliding motility-associated-like protein
MLRLFSVLVLSLFLAFSTFGQVANDNCTSAQVITIPSSGNVCITSTTVNALSDNSTSSCDTGTPGNEVWFTFIATGSQNTVTVTPTGSPAIQQAIVAIDGTGCADNAFNICNAATTNNGTATATWTFTPGTQVWVSVESNNGVQGSFQLCVTSVTPPPSPGSSCATATNLCNKNTFSVNSFPGNGTVFQPPCFGDPLQRPIFYKFTVGASGTCAWQADPTGSTEYDWAMYNITNGCPGTIVCCNWNFGYEMGNPVGMAANGLGTCNENGASMNALSELSPPANVVAGQTYLIIIDNYSNNTTGFTFTWGGTFQMAPTAQFTVNPITACGSATVSITNTSVAASTYSWNFNNGNTSTLPTPPNQTYSSPGTYLISLTATSASNCTSTSSQTVTVNPNHTITAGSNQPVCVNVAMTNITMTLGGGATGATSSGLPPGVSSSVSGGVVTISGTPTAAGTYNYTITTTGNACTVATTTGTIIVVSIPTPTITTVPPTCAANGTASVSNYNPSFTYTFSPTGPTIGAGGAISGMTPGTNYTLIAGNGTCNSTASAQFNIAAQLTTPATPTIVVVTPTCAAAGSASTSNYSGTLTYTFTPSGPVAGAAGVISGMTAGTNYTVTSGNGSCTSAPSLSFAIAAQLTTPAVPTITVVPPTCSSNGTASITNYNASLTYTFNPTGPTAGASGTITGMTVGTNYTLTAGDGSCTSAPSSSFSIASQLITPTIPTITIVPPTCIAGGSASISNYDGTLTYISSPSGLTIGAGGAISGMIAGTNYTVTAGNGTCTSAPSLSFSIAAQLTTPAVPTITVLPPTCSSNGTATITNYNASLTYTFNPTGPTAGANGTITGMTVGTNYTLTAGNGSCTSAPSSSFSIAAQLTTPAIPTITIVPPTCIAGGSASISNYDGTLTYISSPSGLTIGAGGAISGMTVGTNYTVTAGNGSCTSAPSLSFSIAAQLTIPAVPTITTNPPTCTGNGTATITNFLASLTYTFTPTGPTAGANGVISGMTVGTSYTVIAGNGSCSSAASTSFSITAQLITPAVPTTSVVAPTCAAGGSASITNYDGTLTYTFSPSGPTVGASGAISGMTTGTNYTVTAGNANCTSAASSPFSILAQLTTPPVPTITTTPASCSSNGTATITNYNAALTYTFTPTGPTTGAGGTISGMTVGISYTVIAGNGSCSSSPSNAFSIASQLITPPVPTITVTSPTCSTNGTATISNYNGTLTYTFSPAGPSIGAGGLISGMIVGSNYTVTAGNGTCTSAPSTSFSTAPQLTTPPVPTITTTPATCSSNETASISNYVTTQTYTFTPTGPTVGAIGLISGLTVGTSYTVTASNGPCTSAASIPFTIDAPIPFPSIPFQVDNPVGCSPHTATLSAVNIPGIQYQWTANGSLIGNGASLTSTFTNAGCYDIQLTISDAQGCVATSSEPDFVCVEANPVAAFTPNPTLFTDNSQNVIFSNSSTGAETYVWDFGDLSTSTETNPTHYYTNIQGGMIITLTATSALGCIDEATYVINFQEETIFYVPNSFTPDQDEFNQTWGPVFTQGFDPYNFDLYLFNRWGELIWESHDATAQWDGSYGGKALHCPDGIYTWKIAYKPKETDEKKVITGYVNLIR